MDIKRKKYLINKDLQGKFMAILITLNIIVALVVGLFLYGGIYSAVSRQFSERVLKENLDIVGRIEDYEAARANDVLSQANRLARQAQLLGDYEKKLFLKSLREIGVGLIPGFLAILAVIAIGSVFMSHKVAGPLYRLEKYVRAIAEGDLTLKFKLRKGDELLKLADELETMTRSFEAMVGKVKGSISEIQNTTADVSEHVKTQDEISREKLTFYLEDMLKTMGNLSQILSSYKIGGGE